jgi:carbonic anhydrase
LHAPVFIHKELSMSSLDALLANNRSWSQRMLLENAEFFSRLSRQQAPRYLWIGCSDSRVSANEILGLMPGEVFVHRNIANLVVHTDLNCLSVLQYAIEILKVEHVMVVGHYGCGGIQAVAERRSMGLVDNWLRHIEDIANKNASFLNQSGSDEERGRRLCELSVVEQVANVCRSSVVRRAWARGQRFEVHGLVYDLCDGLLRPIGKGLSGAKTWEEECENALASVIATKSTDNTR